jgi:hypothetical protein
MNTIRIIPALLLAGCATAPATWIMADGRSSTPEQFALDQAACRGEMEKSLFTYQEKLNPLDAVYAGCMASHGYLQK